MLCTDSYSIFFRVKMFGCLVTTLQHLVPTIPRPVSSASWSHSTALEVHSIAPSRVSTTRLELAQEQPAHCSVQDEPRLSTAADLPALFGSEVQTRLPSLERETAQQELTVLANHILARRLEAALALEAKLSRSQAEQRQRLQKQIEEQEERICSALHEREAGSRAATKAAGRIKECSSQFEALAGQRAALQEELGAKAARAASLANAVRAARAEVATAQQAPAATRAQVQAQQERLEHAAWEEAASKQRFAHLDAVLKELTASEARGRAACTAAQEELWACEARVAEVQAEVQHLAQQAQLGELAVLVAGVQLAAAVGSDLAAREGMSLARQEAVSRARQQQAEARLVVEYEPRLDKARAEVARLRAEVASARLQARVWQQKCRATQEASV